LKRHWSKRVATCITSSKHTYRLGISSAASRISKPPSCDTTSDASHDSGMIGVVLGCSPCASHFVRTMNKANEPNPARMAVETGLEWGESARTKPRGPPKERRKRANEAKRPVRECCRSANEATGQGTEAGCANEATATRWPPGSARTKPSRLLAGHRLLAMIGKDRECSPLGRTPAFRTTGRLAATGSLGKERPAGKNVALDRFPPLAFLRRNRPRPC
jgi:hypothetical protein